jgi:uncharacterized membrane protein
MRDWLENVFPPQYRWTYAGIFIGFIGSILILCFGFFKAMFIVLCVLAGFLLGRLLDGLAGNNRGY